MASGGGALLVGVGAAAGAALRHHTNELYLRSRLSQRFGQVWGIAGVNVVGSFMLGAAVAWQPAEETRLLLGTGFCGGLTTFSTFAVDSVQLAKKGGPARLGAYVVLTNVGAIGAAALGFATAMSLKRRRSR